MARVCFDMFDQAFGIPEASKIPCLITGFFFGKKIDSQAPINGYQLQLNRGEIQQKELGDRLAILGYRYGKSMEIMSFKA